MILNDTPIQLLTQHVQVLSNLNINPTLNIIQLLSKFVRDVYLRVLHLLQQEGKFVHVACERRGMSQ